MRTILRDIFRSRSTAQWIAFGIEFNTPIAPVNTPANLVDDPQFKARFRVLPHQQHGADMLGFPVKFVGEAEITPTKAPTPGQHSEQVLREVLGYDAARIAALRGAGALG